MKKIIKGFSAFIFFVIISTGLCVYADDLSEETLKVGFFANNGYHEIDENERYSGYGYELIEKMRVYHNWNVEYIGYDCTISEMFEMLDNGEIDILSGINHNELRDQKYLFSDQKDGICSTVIRGRIGNNSIVPGDFDTYNGKKYGLLRGDYSAKSFMIFAEENHFEYEAVYFDYPLDAEKALFEEESIDCIVSSSYLALEKESVLIDSFDESNTYIVARRSDKKLMQDINETLLLLNKFEPDVFVNLQRKYFGNVDESAFVYNDEEKSIIEKYKGKTLKGIIFDSSKPYVYYKDSELLGILPRLLKLIFAKTGINVDIDVVYSEEEYLDSIISSEYAFAFDSNPDYYIADSFGYRITPSYMSSPMIKAYNTSREPVSGKAGLIATYNYSQITLPKEYSSFEISFYNSYDELYKHLVNHDIDVAFLSSYSFNYLYDASDGVNFTEIPGLLQSFCIGIVNEEYFELLPIFSKAVNLVSGSEIDNIILDEITKSKRADNLISYVSNDTTAIFVVFILFFAIILTLSFLIIRNLATQKEQKLNQELEAYFQAIVSSSLFSMEISYSNNNYSYFMYIKPEGSDIYKKISFNDEDFNEFFSRVHPDDYVSAAELFSFDNLSKIINEDYKDYREIRLLQDSAYSYISLSAQKVFLNSNSVKRILIIARDINNAKENEKEQRNTLMAALDTAKNYSESKSRFLSNMSHDIRTPLNAIVGMTTLARLNIDNRDEVNECLDTISKSSDHLLNLVNEILDISKIENGKISFNRTRVSIIEIFKNSVSMLSTKASEKNIKLIYDNINVKNKMIVTDATRLEQIFGNIINNAVKYTGEGGEVSISLNEEDSGKEGIFFYKFIVKDNGCGMSPEMIDNIFKPFERSKNVTNIEGVGLGMSITKSIVDAMGGIIEIDSKEGIGTTMTVSLTFSDDSAVKETPDKKVKEITKNCVGKNALIVEDVEINAIFAQAIAEMKGFKVRIAGNGKEAVEILENSEDMYYSLVLMDVQMPVMNGYEATEAIRSSSRDYLKNIPILAMSANTFPEDILRSKNAGMNDHISKPVDINVFSSLVDKYVKD